MGKTILIAVVTLLMLPALSFAEGKSVYGEDNRLDYFAAAQDMKTLSDSVVSLWKTHSVETLNPGEVKLKTVSLDNYIMARNGGSNLCPGEKFREQPTGAFCSGALVGEDLMMTAGHCIRNAAECAATRIVFGYAVKKEGEAAVTTLPASEVYGCSRVIKRFRGKKPAPGNPAGQTQGADYALVQLDRKVTGHKPLPINRKADLKNGDGIVLIGYPLGLPLKIAGGAAVRDFSRVGYFTANLDAFVANSGSPVFNAMTRKIEGILVRGKVDFAYTPIEYPDFASMPYFVYSPAGCITMATYKQTEGGEDVTKISALSPFISELGFLDRVLFFIKMKLHDLTTTGKVAADLPEVKDVNSRAIQSIDITPSRVVSFDQPLPQGRR